MRFVLVNKIGLTWGHFSDGAVKCCVKCCLLAVLPPPRHPASSSILLY